MKGLWDPVGNTVHILAVDSCAVEKKQFVQLEYAAMLPVMATQGVPPVSNITVYLLWSSHQNTLSGSKSVLIYVQQFPQSLTVDLFQNRVWNFYLCQYNCFEGKGYIALKLFISRPRNLLKIMWSSVTNHWFGHWNKEKTNPVICKNAEPEPRSFRQMVGADFPLVSIGQIVIFRIKGRSYLLWKWLAPFTEKLVECQGFMRTG